MLVAEEGAHSVEACRQGGAGHPDLAGSLGVSWVRPLESRPELPPGGASVSFAIFKKTCVYYF